MPTVVNTHGDELVKCSDRQRGVACLVERSPRGEARWMVLLRREASGEWLSAEERCRFMAESGREGVMLLLDRSLRKLLPFSMSSRRTGPPEVTT